MEYRSTGFRIILVRDWPLFPYPMEPGRPTSYLDSVGDMSMVDVARSVCTDHFQGTSRTKVL